MSNALAFRNKATLFKFTDKAVAPVVCSWAVKKDSDMGQMG
jgi:hypothetical protein